MAVRPLETMVPKKGKGKVFWKPGTDLNDSLEVEGLPVFGRCAALRMLDS